MPIPSVKERLEWLKPVPPSPEALELVNRIKPGEYEIGVQTTNDILDEAMEVFVRSCRGSLGVAGDSIVAIFTPEGDLVNASCGTYLHAIIQPILIKYILKYYRENPGIEDGDIWYTNDAVYGGIHNPDRVIVMPVFFKGQLIAWVSAALHTPETGAIEPGGMPLSARSRFEEGLNLPPLKIGEKFKLRDDFLELYAVYGVRAPQAVLSDLRARCTTADRARLRLLEVAKKRGIDYLKGLLYKMILVAQEGARKKIKQFPDGRYRSVAFNDALGWTQALVRSCYLTVVKDGDRLLFDFTGTSPETPSSYNAHPQAVVGHVANFIYEYLFHDLPISSATFSTIDFLFPPNTILSPDLRAATSCCVYTAMQARNMCHNCFGKMMYSVADSWQQVTASHGTQHSAQIISGVTQWKLPISDILAYPLNTMGQGGRASSDGMDAYGFTWCAFGRAPDVEQMENEWPLMTPFSLHWKDSCGYGKYRGGAGTVQMWVIHHVPGVWSLCMGNGSKLPLMQPLFGGYTSPPIPGISIVDGDVLARAQRGDKELTFDHHQIVENRSLEGQWQIEFIARPPRYFKTGEAILGYTGGGAGYGDPLERDPELVLKDLREKIVSDWVAQNIYKVVFHPGGRKVDHQRTEELRRAEREARKSRGVPFERFEQEWREKRPPEDILQWYGSWPDAELVHPVYRP